MSNGNAVVVPGELCANGVTVNAPEATAACAICPEPTNVASCSTTNTLGLNTFNENGDDTICFEFNQDPNTLMGDACEVTVSSSIGSIDTQTASFTTCSVTFDGSGNVLSMNLANTVDSIVLAQLNDAPCGHAAQQCVGSNDAITT